jgi:uncharacterized membrane protein
MTTPPKNPVTGWQRTIVIVLDKLIYRFSRNWVWVFNIVAFIYVGLPILAPVLMNAGVTGPARIIYLAYGPMCHQMASRSFFLFGEQSVYPRELAGTDFTSIETYMLGIPEFAGVPTDPAQWTSFLIPARQFLGNAQMGYKMALCERDIGIYGFVLIGGVLYALLHRRLRLKPLPFMAFIILGLGPIGLDGFTQLLSMYGVAANFAPLEAIFPLRESPPLLRTFTGAWFGLTLVWLAYPRIEESLKQTERDLEAKLRRIGELA